MAETAQSEESQGNQAGILPEPALAGAAAEGPLMEPVLAVF